MVTVVGRFLPRDEMRFWSDTRRPSRRPVTLTLSHREAFAQTLPLMPKAELKEVLDG